MYRQGLRLGATTASRLLRGSQQLQQLTRYTATSLVSDFKNTSLSASNRRFLSTTLPSYSSSSNDAQENEMTDAEKDITNTLMEKFPGGDIIVQDVSGGCGTFYAIQVAHQDFNSITTIKQHRLVNKALGDEVKKWHGVQLKTLPKKT